MHFNLEWHSETPPYKKKNAFSFAVRERESAEKWKMNPSTSWNGADCYNSVTASLSESESHLELVNTNSASHLPPRRKTNSKICRARGNCAHAVNNGYRIFL